jgi:rhodanese-related sulfurtransferase
MAAAVVDRTPGATAGDGSAITGVLTIPAPELATRIMQRDGRMRVLDLRSRDAFDAFHVPTAVNATAADVATMQLPPAATMVVYADSSAVVAQAAAELRRRGVADVRVLREGVHEWIGRVLDPRLPPDATADEKAEFARAEELSRFFGGSPQITADRSEVPAGYWTGTPQGEDALARAARASVAAVRRRGC